MDRTRFDTLLRRTDVRIGVTSIALLGYAAVAVVLGNTMGPGITIASIVPAIIAGLLWGSPLGPAIAAGLAFGVNPLIIGAAGHGYTMLYTTASALLGAAAVVTIAHVVGVMRDLRLRLTMELVARQDAQEAMSRARAKLEIVLETAPSGIFTVDTDQRIVSWNQTAEKMTGLRMSAVIGKKCTEIWHCPDCLKGCGLFAEHVKKPLLGITCQVTVPAGKTMTISKNLDLIRNENGDVVGGIEIFEDVTERIKTEKALRESEENFRHIFESSSEALNIVDAQTGRFIAVNPTMSAMFGYSEQELAGMPPSQLVAPEDADRQKEALQILKEDGVILNHEGTRLHRNGTRIPVLISALPSVWRGKKAIYESMRDIAELKDFQRRLETKNLEILEFTDMVTHDLRKPLTTMGLICTMVAEESVCSLNENGREVIAMGKEALGYMQELLEDLMACAKLETGTHELDREEVLVSEVVDEAVRRLQYQANAAHVTLRTRNLDWRIVADRKGLVKVFMNLIGNAISYIGQKPDRWIEISSNIDGSTRVFYVKDNGMGIPLESRDTLFDKFKRGANAAGIAGTGLGLAIVKGVVEAHGGAIRFESEVGSSTTFFFTLPDAAPGTER